MIVVRIAEDGTHLVLRKDKEKGAQARVINQALEGRTGIAAFGAVTVPAVAAVSYFGLTHAESAFPIHDKKGNLTTLNIGMALVLAAVVAYATVVRPLRTLARNRAEVQPHP